jgi:RNA-directed DNA polymerase
LNSIKSQKSKAEKLSPTGATGERHLPEPTVGVSLEATESQTTYVMGQMLIEEMIEKENLQRALKRVMGNGGSAGVDQMTTEELPKYLECEWPRLRRELLDGRYIPRSVRLVEIPKPTGGVRQLGIPTVVDRFIQQALLQVLTPIFDPTFSENSYGFRPNRSAHQAILKAQEYVQAGRGFVVDLDLEKFFDRVNHDILMSRVAQKVRDKRVLKLVRRYLNAGIMRDGIVSPREEGTPQGGPLSPLLSNILLDDLDKELERRGHKFCRYADDCNIYVQTEISGERVMRSVTSFLEKKLKLMVNAEKSQVARPSERKFLGYSFTSGKAAKLKPSKTSVDRLKAKLKTLFHKGRGRNLGQFIVKDLNPVLRGWMTYFQYSQVKLVFEDLDKWVRRCLRCLLWRQWKKCRTRETKLAGRGLDKKRAHDSSVNGRGPWWNSGASHMNEAFPKSYFENLQLISLVDRRKLYGRT